MPGDFGAPYRPPCGGWPAEPRHWLPNHSKPTEVVQIWENITKLRDFNDLAQFVPAYPLGLPGGGSCPDTECDQSRTEGVQPCSVTGPYDLDYWLWPCSAGAGETVRNAPDLNCYRFKRDEEGQPVQTDRQTCRKVGFKNVQAVVNWYGHLPFSEQCECDGITPQQGRYRRFVVSYYRHDGGPGGALAESWFNGTVEVNPDTGELKRTNCRAETITSGLESYGEEGGPFVFWVWDPRDSTPCFSCPWYELFNPLTIEFWGGTCGARPVVLQWTEPGEYFEDAVVDYESWGPTGGSYRITFSNADGFHDYIEVTYALQELYPFSSALARANEMLRRFPLNNDALYPWRTDDLCSVAPIIRRDQAPYRDLTSVVQEPCLVNDYRHPVNDASENEPFTELWSPTYAQMGWFDPLFYDWVFAPGEDATTAAAIALVARYTGLENAPNPAGFDGHFDFNHLTYEAVLDGPNCVICEVSKGARSGHSEAGDPSDQVVPRAATRWTNTEEAALLPRRGAFIQLTGTNAGASIWVQKWAEVLLPWESVNFARPCGEDRGVLEGLPAMDWIDEGSSTFPNIVTEGDSTLATDDYCAVKWGAYDGIYKVTKTGIGQFDLGAKLWDVPSWLSAPSSGLRQWHTNTIARMRWIDKRGICSTTGVVSAEQTAVGEVTITVDADVFLLGRPIGTSSDGEELDFTDVPGLGTSVEVIEVTDLRTFKVAGTLGGTYESGGTVVAAGYDAALDKWTDDNPKRDFITRVWTENAWTEEDGRTWTLAATQRCLFPSPCHPSVICFSPSSEDSFPHGLTLLMPGNLTVDSCHGTQWSADVLQAVADPFWNIPPGPQAEDSWLEDNGTCLADVEGESTIAYYPHRPMVEPRLTLPTIDEETAPALVGGLDLIPDDTGPPTPAGYALTCSEQPGASGMIHVLWLLVRAYQDCNGYGTWWRGCP